MEARQEEFEQVLRSRGVNVDADRGGGREKRRAPRVNQRMKVEIVLCANLASAKPVTKFEGHYMTPVREGTTGVGTIVTVRNVSSRGLSILLHEPLTPGQQFIVSLGRGKPRPIRILCTVVHCDELAVGLYAVGAEFTCALDKPFSPLPDATRAAQLQKIRLAMLG